MISPLAIALHELRRGKPRVLPVGGLVVHTTGGGPARSARKLGIPADERALAYYLRGNGGFPHYLIDRDGDLFAICDEGEIANHAGWANIGGTVAWRKWKAPKWWCDAWIGWSTPIDLVEAVNPLARTPNAVYLGCELLADESGWNFTAQQYLKLAMLWVDMRARYPGLPHADTLPMFRLCGHEDLNPTERASGGKPWDPGAHRPDAKFSWVRLAEAIRRCGTLPRDA